MQRLAAREELALEQLYDRHASTLLAIALRVLKDRHAAEDVLIDVFAEIWERADRYNPHRGAPRTYLQMLTRSRAIDRRRSLTSGVKRTVSTETAMTGSIDGQSLPDEAAEMAESHHFVRQALDSLTEAQRVAVELSFFEGLSHREIAEQLDKPLGTIKTQIRSGLIQLRKQLEGFFSAEGDE